MNLAAQIPGTRLTLDLWHPNCWAIEATERTGGGVLAHAIYDSPTTETGRSSVNGLFTAFGDDEAEVERLFDVIRESDRAGELLELQEQFGCAHSAPGTVVREFFLEYNPDDMICPTLLENGFIHRAPIRIENGREQWAVGFAGERAEIENSLQNVRERAGAEVTVDSITTSDATGRSLRDQRLDTLTTTQRKVFDHAREEGYYEWPRETSTRELAADLDLSKTTLLEHLRKAESKLLDP